MSVLAAKLSRVEGLLGRSTELVDDVVVLGRFIGLFIDRDPLLLLCLLLGGFHVVDTGRN
jgi:hypothetical protein